MKSLTGNMFDQRHQNVADEIHRIEAATYQAKFHEDLLKKQHDAYQGALQELMSRFATAVGAHQQKLIKKLILNLKEKSQTMTGEISIASRESSRSENRQLHEAVRLAQSLTKKQKTSMLEPTVAILGPRSTDTRKRPKTKALQQPSAVRAAVMRILQQPG